MGAPTHLGGEAAPEGKAGRDEGAAPNDREGRRAEALILAVIFAGAAAEVVALCALLW